MRRRDFISLVGVSAVVWPLSAQAQQTAIPVIGFLNSSSASAYEARADAFRQGLAETGYVEGRTVAIEYRWANNQTNLLPAMADDLVRRKVAVIIANGPAAFPAKTATTTIPIVFTAGFDPVQLGLVTSLNRPGGNLTGISILNEELGPKRLELLRDLVPKAVLVGLLVNPTNPSATTLSRAIQAAAGAFGLRLHTIAASRKEELANAFETLVQMHADGLVVGNDPLFNSLGKELGTLSVRHRMPAIFQYREFVESGGLLSYGSSLSDSYRQAGIYVGRILNGEKASDLPIQQSTKVEMIINLKTAKALGLTVPLPLLGRANEMIE